jgi:hypothetical protein
LKGLSQEEHYQELIHCIDMFPVSCVHGRECPCSPVNHVLPRMCHSHQLGRLVQNGLPGVIQPSISSTFHQSHAEFEEFVKWLRSSPHRSTILDPYGRTVMVLICLGIGLVLQDLHMLQFELGEDSSDEHLDPTVKHMKHSKLGWAQTQVLLRCCQDLRRDIRLCFNEEDDPDTPTPLPAKSRAPRSRRKPGSPKPGPSNRRATRWTTAATKQ